MIKDYLKNKNVCIVGPAESINNTNKGDYIDGFDGPGGNSKYDDWDSMDLHISWSTPWDGELSFGARNITDEDPSIASNGVYDDTTVLELYDVTGRTPYVTYKHFF